MHIRDWNHFIEIAKSPGLLSDFRALRGHVNCLIRDCFDPSAITLTIFRDPIDRAFAMLKHMRRKPNFFRTSLGEKIQTYSLEELIVHPEIRCALDNQHTRLLGRRSVVPDRSSAVFIGETGVFEAEENLLSVAKQNIDTFDIVGIFESFPETVAMLCHKIGACPVTILPHVNGAEDTELMMSKLIRTELVKLNELDIELYNHAKKIFEKQLSTLSKDPLRDFLFEMESHAPIHTIPCSLDLRAMVPGEGWWAYEEHGEERVAVRWTGPGAYANFHLKVQTHGSHEVVLKIEVVRGITDTFCDSISALCNGTLLERVAGRDLTWKIPSSVLLQPPHSNTFELRTPPTQQPPPVSPGKGDPRYLGVLIRSIALLPFH